VSHLNHDLAPGYIEGCQICGHKDLIEVLNLGHQPLCDSLLSAEDLKKPETSYPLRQVFCPRCTLNQIDYVVPGDVVYHPNYPYRSGITKELAVYQKAFSDEIVSKFKFPAGVLAVDIGSNDGTLLSGFKKNGFKVLGVEPTNIAKIAREENQIDTVQTPFTEEVAKEIVKTHGQAHVITATNVFAHMATLGQVMRGVQALLHEDGVFTIENHYLLQVLEKTQFDTIYHEHLRTYSLRSLVTLFELYGMTLFDARQVDRYGGNIRVYVTKKKNAAQSAEMKSILEMEKRVGFDKPETYARFQKNSIAIKNNLLAKIIDFRAKGHAVVGNSCPGRCSTLLNFAGIGPDLLPYLAEQPTSLKIGKFLPGKHIPVVNNQRLIDEQPEYVLLLAWHYAGPIIEQLRERGLKSKFIVPFPEVAVI